ncbi:MAG TPA: FAD binding domain-containing protein [Gaiellaceae bacterium]|jgi:probable selenate reductase FAD-binding subunit
MTEHAGRASGARVEWGSQGKVAGYSRPGTLAEALDLLEQPGAVVLAGGTRLNTDPRLDPVRVVDLQALGLSGISRLGDGALRIGAMATLQQVVDDEGLPVALRDAARRSEASALRTLATVGGYVARAEPESEFLATLLVHDAQVVLAGRDGEQTLQLAVLLADLPRLAGRIVTAIAIDGTGVTSSARVGRTRADRPIVAAVARRTPDGELRLALTGVASTPVLVAPALAAEELDPPNDFRGSSEYRRALAATLVARVLEAVG